MASSSKKLRSDGIEIFLVGKCENEILGAKLPSIKQALQVFFHKLRIEKSDIKTSAQFAIDLVTPFWDKARIPIQTKQNCAQKLEKFYKQWTLLKKNVNTKSELHRQRESDFCDKIEDLFDIAAPNAMEIMKITEDKDFLEQQRKKGRPGSMLGIDKKLTEKENRKQKRLDEQERRKRKHMDEMAASSIGNIDDSSETSSSTSENIGRCDGHC